MIRECKRKRSRSSNAPAQPKRQNIHENSSEHKSVLNVLRHEVSKFVSKKELRSYNNG
jgi:hypothetical protein